jgi:hypothetical protein
LSKFLLFQGDRAAAEELWPLIEFSAASVLRHTTTEGIIASETDEMEGRYPTGKANLSTSALAYGGYRLAARLAQTLGKPVAAEFDQRADALRQGIEPRQRLPGATGEQAEQEGAGLGGDGVPAFEGFGFFPIGFEIGVGFAVFH